MSPEVATGSLYQRRQLLVPSAPNIPGKPRQFGVYLGGFAAYKRRCDAVAANRYEGFELSEHHEFG